MLGIGKWSSTRASNDIKRIQPLSVNYEKKKIKLIVKRFYGKYLIFIVKNKITVVNNWFLSTDSYNELWINYAHSRLIDAWKDKVNPFIPSADLYFIILIDFRSSKNNMKHLFRRGRINQTFEYWICIRRGLQVDKACVKKPILKIWFKLLWKRMVCLYVIAKLPINLSVLHKPARFVKFHTKLL